MKTQGRGDGWSSNQTKSYTSPDNFFDAADRDLSLSGCEGAQSRVRFDTDAVKLACRVS